MTLVDYSDSESDDNDTPAAVSTAPPTSVAKPVFQKAAPGKLQVNLPALKPEPDLEGGEADTRPAKRARTGGAFSGFNALLPAPKKIIQNVPKKGVNLKTSSEAAFSRNPLPTQQEPETSSQLEPQGSIQAKDQKEEAEAEPKLVGKNTRFLPLSVSSKKKKKPLTTTVIRETGRGEAQGNGQSGSSKEKEVLQAPQPPVAKPKKSLFSMSQDEERTIPETHTGEYEPITIARTTAASEDGHHPEHPAVAAPANPNSLEAVAADMNLTPAQRRQLFGRGGKDAQVAHFSLDAQYAENERARQAGEVVEHRAVKAVAPGKHSLQQLVNNARSQQDAMEDKWAEGRRNRGEGGSKYGWSTG
jgi:hypothetical protein